MNVARIKIFKNKLSTSKICLTIKLAEWVSAGGLDMSRAKKRNKKIYMIH